MHQGPLTVSTNGAVLENVEVRGRLTIAANDVTVRNVKVVTDDFWVVMVNGSRALLTDSTFIGGDNSQAALAGAGWVGRRLDLSGAGDGIKMHDGGELYDSYIHDLSNAAGAHNDGIEAGGPVKIVHNTILNRRSQTSCIMLSEYGANPDTDVLIQNNLLGGAGFTVYGGAPDTARGHEVRDNKFTTRFFPQSGYYGPVAYWSPAGNIWSGNVWADGPLAGQTVNP
ncbi:MAG: hypothetical protein IPJ65_10635 [Archangiaceae bacterium]|nr:hypothetical protein [Archangiaceae bacterium]